MVHLSKDAAGHLHKAAGGHLAKCAECDECEHCTGCGANLPDCPGAPCCTPSRWQAVVSGVTPDTSCIACGVHTKSLLIHGSYWNPNGTYTIIQVPDHQCLWRYLTPSVETFDAREYSTANCTGAYGELTDDKAGVYLYRAGATEYRIYVVPRGGHYGFNDRYFYASVAVTANRCDQNIGATANQQSKGGCSNDLPRRWADDGTVTLTVCP